VASVAIGIDVDSMLHSERPELFVDYLRPVGLGMKQHCKGPTGDKSNAVFNDTVHMMSTSAGDGLPLS